MLPSTLVISFFLESPDPCAPLTGEAFTNPNYCLLSTFRTVKKGKLPCNYTTRTAIGLLVRFLYGMLYWEPNLQSYS
jgi:hypothetical protein